MKESAVLGPFVAFLITDAMQSGTFAIGESVVLGRSAELLITDAIRSESVVTIKSAATEHIATALMTDATKHATTPHILVVIQSQRKTRIIVIIQIVVADPVVV